jgi:hypothetical protein
LGFTAFFGPHISWRFACCGGAAFVDFGISKNFPVGYRMRRVYGTGYMFKLTQCLLSAHELSE